MPADGGTGKDARPTVRVVISTDGKRGHENQSRVLARMLGDTEPLVMRLRNPEGGWGETLLRVAFAIRGTWPVPVRSAGERVRELMRPESPSAFRDFSNEIGKHRGDYRIFTVSTGTPPATGNLLLSKLLSAEPLCVMTPSVLPRRLFELCIVPLHDRSASRASAGAVIVHPLALSYHDEARAKLQARELTAEAGLSTDKTYWALAIGGSSKSIKWSLEAVRKQVYAYSEAARLSGARLLITTSRRTSPNVTQLVRVLTQDLCDYFLDAAKDERNPLPAFYELSQSVAVTVDSFSMICEAVQAGFKPHLLMPGRIRGKLHRMLARLQDLGLVDLLQDFQTAEIPAGRGKPNIYYDELRAEVRSRLSLD
jgi:mitochondrial fission protein ELM1